MIREILFQATVVRSAKPAGVFRQVFDILTPAGWWLLILAGIPTSVGSYFAATCGAVTKTTFGPCRRLRKGPFVRCHQHSGQGFVRYDRNALLAYGIAGFVTLIWWTMTSGGIIDRVIV
jgi:hypothetical protein